MIKVFLVEDEFVVREGIKNNVPWNEYGYSFCGEASDGELAYSQIRITRPDIILMDIKMPFMNGLELSRLVKREYPDIKIIILSGYSEFQFAKEAINIGVEEYLLKPINAEELIDAVNRVSQKIILERQEKENYKKFLNEMKENEIELKRNYFYDLISSNQSLSDILSKGKKLGIDLSAAYYNIILFKVTRFKCGDEAFSSRIIQITEELNQYFEKENIITFDRKLEGMALLLKSDSLEEMKQSEKIYITEIERIIKKYEHITYFGGIGSIVNRLSELYISYEEASRAFAYRFIMDENQFLDADKLLKSKNQEEDFRLNIIDAEHIDKEKVENFLRNGELGEVNYFVEEYLKNFACAGEKSVIFRQYIIMDMYFITVNFIDQLGRREDNFKIEDPFHSPQEMNRLIKVYSETEKYIKHLFSQAIAYRNKVATKKFSNIIDETKAYIHKNYWDEELSLNSAASFVNISPSYLSAIFSQETGQSFVKYLTDLRMNKAKELLMCTNKRSNEISTEVGYKDPHYFSYLFKKLQGCSPLQFRMNKSRNEEVEACKREEKSFC